MRMVSRSFFRILNGAFVSLNVIIFIAMINSGRHATQKVIRISEPQVMAIDKSSIISPYFRFREAYTVVKKYRMATCQIEKVMSTIQDAIFCYLTDSKSFTANNRTISGEHWANRFCSDSRHNRKNLDEIYEELGQNLTLFTVVRDPFDRLISGFVDKCINERSYTHPTCYSCRGSLRCFIYKLQNSLQKASKMGKNTPLKYFYDRHFAPQTWYCDFQNHLNDYTIIKYAPGKEGYAKTAASLDEVFRKAGVPSYEREVIRNELLKGTTVHSTHGSREVLRTREQLLSDEELLSSYVIVLIFFLLKVSLTVVYHITVWIRFKNKNAISAQRARKFGVTSNISHQIHNEE